MSVLSGPTGPRAALAASPFRFPWAGVLRPFRALVLSVLLGPTGLGGESLLSPHVGEPVAADRFGSLLLVVSRASADDLRAHVVVGIGIEN